MAKASYPTKPAPIAGNQLYPIDSLALHAGLPVADLEACISEGLQAWQVHDQRFVWGLDFIEYVRRSCHRVGQTTRGVGEFHIR